jgi:hypothetical protein
VQQDDMAPLLPKQESADIVVYATPLYVDGMNGTLKTFLDRSIPLIEPFFEVRDDHCRHPRRGGPEDGKVVLVSACGFTELDNFDPLVMHVKAVCRNLGREYAGALLRPYASSLPEMKKLGLPVAGVLAAAEEAGRQMVEQGRMALDDDLSKYLPTFPLQGHHVTIRQLLNHTSGIRSYTSKPEAQRFWAMDVPPDSIIAVVAGDPFDFPPGTSWRYNNTGYVLLGMIIEQVSGRPYAAYVDEQFFQPLRLGRTRYCPSRNARDQRSRWLRATGAQRQLQPAEYISMTHPFSAGALCSNAREYLVWQRALHGGRVLNETSYRLMITPDTLANGQRLIYGFGLMTGTLGLHPKILHSGGIPGFDGAAVPAYRVTGRGGVHQHGCHHRSRSP